MTELQALELENSMWNKAKNQDSKGFLELVDSDAVMVCGGFRCFGREYAEVVNEFDCKYYLIENFEIVNESNDSYQVHYVLTMDVNDPMNNDLAGVFHITSTWRRINDNYKLVFNMDHKVE